MNGWPVPALKLNVTPMLPSASMAAVWRLRLTSLNVTLDRKFLLPNEAPGGPLRQGPVQARFNRSCERNIGIAELLGDLPGVYLFLADTMLSAREACDLARTAAHTLRNCADWHLALDALPLPVYTTDADGAVTYWNDACVDFAGREPQLGEDRWCVTFELYSTAGDRILHEDCPMAEAIRSNSEVRGKIAIALRPDGTRRAFVPYPTPIVDGSGDLVGAVNLLVDVSEEQANSLQEQSERCKRLAKSVDNPADTRILEQMAEGYAATAGELQASLGSQRLSSIVVRD